MEAAEIGEHLVGPHADVGVPRSDGGIGVDRFLRFGGFEQDARGIWTAPGGDRVAWFTDPDGNSVEVVHGREPAASLPAPHAQPYNTGQERRRLNVLQRVEKGKLTRIARGPVEEVGAQRVAILRHAAFRSGPAKSAPDEIGLTTMSSSSASPVWTVSRTRSPALLSNWA